jgi:predicted ArsR family transcriptional regulator
VPGAARHDDPETSQEAAQSVDAANLEKLVYDYMLTRPKRPVILDDIVKNVIHDKVTASPRFAKLQEAGLIELTGIKRPGESGRPQQEWRLKGVHVND